MGISYVAVVLPRFIRAKCLRDTLGVMPKVALGDLLGDPLGRKESRRGAKTRSMAKRKSSLVLGKGSFQTHWTLSGASGHDRFDRRDEELERLRRLVRDLELEARGMHRKRDRDERAEGSASVEGGYGEVPHQSSSHRHQDWSREYADRDSISPERQRPWNAATNAMS